MVDLSISIGFAVKHDYEQAIERICSMGIERPIYCVESKESFFIAFETNEYTESIFDVLRREFDSYDVVESLGVGEHNVRISVTEHKSPLSTDNWGRSFNTDSVFTTLYFLMSAPTKEEEVKIEKSERVFTAIFEQEKNDYVLHLAPVVVQESGAKGFIVTKTPFSDNEKPTLISKKLFPNPSSAFWEGFHMLKPQIEQEYDEFLKTKRKRKRKP